MMTDSLTIRVSSGDEFVERTITKAELVLNGYQDNEAAFTYIVEAFKDLISRAQHVQQ